MTWKPSHGLWSTENFDSVVGFTGKNLEVQSVTGGYAALLPQINRSVSYLHSWAAISGWQVNNSLNTRTLIEQDFMVTGGRVNASDTATGLQTSAGAGGMWKIFTPPLLGTHVEYSGQTFEYTSLETGSPFSGYYYRMRSSSDSLVVEFDVASHVAVPESTPLVGITGGLLTGLDALTGRVNHGLYISNGPNWDFLECRPDGIRSLNHPELALPVKLSQPNRFRVGVRNNDIFILHEGGKGIAGIGQFNTASNDTRQPILAFGAPYTGYHFSFQSGMSGVQGFEGESYWDNFKVYMGEDFPLDDVGGKLENVYTTEAHFLYTPPFEAGVALRKWDSATINYVPKDGGVTTVTPQYLTALGGSDTTGWVSVASEATVLEAGRHSMRIDLSAVPASVPSQQTYGSTNDHSIQSTKSTIRFMIEQWSTFGQGPAPLVDSISVQGFKDLPYLETVPDWKPVGREADINLYIRTDKFLRNRMEPKAHSSFFYRAPRETGAASGSFTSVANSGQVGSIIGTGEIVSGPYDTAFQNYHETTGWAMSGSSASKEFGLKGVENFVPDPQFNTPFRDVSAMEIYKTGYQKGKVGKFVEMPRDWTGQVQLEMVQHPVHRLGQSTTTDYAQKVKVINTPYDNACGIEIAIPDGITENGKKGIFKFSLSTEGVDGLPPPDIVVYASGSASANEEWFSGTLFSGAYRAVSIPVDFVGTGRARLGVVASGNRGNFIVDDLHLSPIETAHLTCTNVQPFTRPFGVIGRDYDFYTNNYPSNPQRAATVASCDLLLDLYPTGENILLKHTRDSDNLGFTLKVNSEGFLVCDYDLMYDAELSGGFTGSFESFTGTSFYDSSTGEVFYKSESITGEMITPLGRWTNIGFIHQAHAFRRYGGRASSGQSGLGSIASCNKSYLTIDGLPVASQDTMTGWVGIIISGYTGLGENGSTIAQAAPLPTYVASNSGRVAAVSGIYCRVANINISSPPSADAESSLYIDAARAGVPYFTPDVMLKPGGIDQDYNKNNALSNTTTGDNDSPGIYAQSIWNLDNPGPITNWDHGANRNHLLFYGTVAKETGVNPYNADFGSTHFYSGGYAKAKYSSSLDLMIQDATGYWTNLENLWPDNGQLLAGVWINTRDTGVFFELSADETQPASDALVLDIVDTTGVRIFRRAGISETWTQTGYLSAGSFLNSWHHIGFDLIWRSQGEGSTQQVSGTFYVDGNVTNIGEGDPTGFDEVDARPFYKGSAEHSMSSALFLARNVDCNLADVFLAANPRGYVRSPVMWDVVSSTGDKGGVYNQVYYGGERFTGAVAYHGYGNAVVTLPASTTTKETTLWAGANEYANDEGENLEGFALLPSTSFTEAESYHFLYDDSPINKVFGGTDSPIRVGFTLPSQAIGLARIDSPSYSVPGAITTIDLSDSNPSNLSTFRGGQFSLSKSKTEHFGKLYRRDVNGGFERPNLGVSQDTFYNLSLQNLQDRKFDFANLQYVGWSIQGQDGHILGPDSAYDVTPGCFAGTGAGGTALDSTLPVTGGFFVSPINGLHALGFHMASGLDSTGIVALQTTIELTGDRDHLFTMSCRQPYYPGNTGLNVTATVVAVSGGLSVPVGAGVVAFWHPTSGQWISGAPNGYGGNGKDIMLPNVAPNDTEVTKTSFLFNTAGFPHEGPQDYAIWVALTGAHSLSANETDIDFVVIDEAHIYEVVTSEASGMYRGINTGDYTGQFDMVFQDQVDTEDLRITSMSVASPELDAPAEAYYAYLLGRGDYVVSIPDSFPHSISGKLNIDTRSGLVDNYVSNLESVKKRIEIRGFDGKPIPDFQWDIVTSPYTYRDLSTAVDEGKSIAIDGIGSGSYSGFLPDGLFSVVMVSPQLPDNGNTVFVHFPAHNVEKGTLNTSHREIFNPIPIMRERLNFETPLAGQFSVTMNERNQKFFDVTVYGVNSGYSGNF